MLSVGTLETPQTSSETNLPKKKKPRANGQAKMVWELIYKESATLKGDDPETLTKTPGTPLPEYSLTQSSLLHVPPPSNATVPVASWNL